jgi:hypothetical protein
MRAISIYTIITLILRRSWGERGVRKSVVTGLLSWFLLDSAGSIASGNASNAIFNVVVLLIAVGPLWRPAGD